jgi:Domain of unknown function (DUF1902)
LGERLVRNEEVSGSIPLSSTSLRRAAAETAAAKRVSAKPGCALVRAATPWQASFDGFKSRQPCLRAAMDSRRGSAQTERMEFTVTVCHDEKESVWFVQSSHVPGLNAEAPTLDALVEVISHLAPDLVAANLPMQAKTASDPVRLRVQHVVDAKSAHAA